MIQNRTKIIGLTGGIGTGKSTVAKLIRDRGFPVIDADLIARKVVNVGESAYIKIVETFGADILNEDKSINRKKLGGIVFSNSELLYTLNKIVHPEIYKRIKEEILKYSKEHNVIFLDVPLLIEEIENIRKSGIILDQIWLVYADYKSQLERVMKRDNIDCENAKRRIKAQLPIEEKIKYADVIIDNTGTMEKLIKDVNKVLDAFC